MVVKGWTVVLGVVRDGKVTKLENAMLDPHEP